MDVMNAVNKFHGNEKGPRGNNASFIRLIPKLDNSKGLMSI